MEKALIPYLIGSALAIVSYLILIGVKKYGIVNFKKFVSHTKAHWDDIVLETINQTRQWFLIILATYIGFQYTPADASYGANADKIFGIILMIQSVIWANYFLNEAIELTIRKKAEKNPALLSAMSLIKAFIKFGVFTLIILTMLSNLGYEVSTVLAGLGVGGIAFALATKSILEDIFSSTSILLDKPFEVGDFIVAGEWQGTVQKIGIKSTRLTSVSGEQIIISNSDLLSSRVRNYKRMKERRATFNFVFSSDMTPEKLTRALAIIEETIKTHEHVRLEGCYVVDFNFHGYPSEVIYWVTNPAYDLYRQIHQKLLFTLMTKFRNAEITLTESKPASPSPAKT